MEKHTLYQEVCMSKGNVKTENVFKYQDERQRKEAVLYKLKELIEKELESSVQIDAIAHLQKKKH